MDFINNFNEIVVFIGLLLEEDHNRNYHRIQRRRLRDEMDPFQMSSNCFKTLFRLEKHVVIDITNDVMPHMPIGNTNSITVTQKVLVTLHFLAVGSYQNSIGANTWLSVSQATVSRAINEVCSLITQHLLPTWVKFPITAVEVTTVKQGFFTKFGFRGVVGAIDGTHIDIIAPPVTDAIHPPFSYINRKGKHSINVMLISDANEKILACNARFPGSVHDAAIWQMSAVRNHLQTNYGRGDSSSHLIGDSGYPLEPWLFTPFLNPRNGAEEQFNTILTTSRNVIERTNGILKGRFRCLSKHRTLVYHPIKAANIIYTCVVLHNVAKHATLEDEDIEVHDEDLPFNEPVNNYDNVHQLGTQARAEYIRNNF